MMAGGSICLRKNRKYGAQSPPTATLFSDHLYFRSMGLCVVRQSVVNTFSLYQISPVWFVQNAYLPVVPSSTGLAVIV